MKKILFFLTVLLAGLPVNLTAADKTVSHRAPIILLPQLNLKDVPRQGNQEANIGIVELSDYQCPYCRAFYEQTFPKLKKDYVDPGLVQFIYMDLPLTTIHAQALAAALAANCAATQGRFWDMHDALFSSKAPLSPTLYFELADQLKLDKEKFSACLRETGRQKKIMGNIAEARRLGISSTPSFLIGRIQGNIMYVTWISQGAPNLQMFAQEFESLRGLVSSIPQTK